MQESRSTTVVITLSQVLYNRGCNPRFRYSEAFQSESSNTAVSAKILKIPGNRMVVEKIT